MSKIKILISGAGPAGLALANLLSKDKYEVTIVEKSTGFMSVGFSIVLWKAGHDILKKIVGLETVKYVHVLEKFSIYAGTNIHLLDSSDTRKVGYSIKREDLVMLLAKKFLSKWSDEAVIFNASIQDVRREDDSVGVRLSNGLNQSYDLVVAADGIHSGIRTSHFAAKLESHPYQITYCWIKPGSNLSKEVIIGFMAGYLYFIQTVGNDALIAFYNKGDESENEQFFHKLSAMIEQERGGRLDLDVSSIHNFTSEEISVSKAHADRIVLIGDAYHGHPPTLAMGTSLALEDAALLASILNEIPISEFNQIINKNLEVYTSKRQSRIREVYKTQTFLEDLLITDSASRTLLMEYLFRHGGWNILEHTLRKIFTGNSSD